MTCRGPFKGAQGHDSLQTAQRKGPHGLEAWRSGLTHNPQVLRAVQRSTTSRWARPLWTGSPKCTFGGAGAGGLGGHHKSPPIRSPPNGGLIIKTLTAPERPCEARSGPPGAPPGLPHSGAPRRPWETPGGTAWGTPFWCPRDTLEDSPGDRLEHPILVLPGDSRAARTPQKSTTVLRI